MSSVYVDLFAQIVLPDFETAIPVFNRVHPFVLDRPRSNKGTLPTVRLRFVPNIWVMKGMV